MVANILVPNGNSGESRQGFFLIPGQGGALRKCLADIFSERASWRIGKASAYGGRLKILTKHKVKRAKN